MNNTHLIFDGDMVSDARRPKRGPIPMKEAIKGRWKNGDRISGSDIYAICIVLNRDDPFKRARAIWHEGENA